MDAFSAGDLARADELSRQALEEGIPPGCAFSGIGPLTFRLTFARTSEVPELIEDGRRQIQELGASDWELAYYLASTATLAALRGHAELARHEGAMALELGRAMASPNITAIAAYVPRWRRVLKPRRRRSRSWRKA